MTTYLGANQEKSYDLRIWIDSAVTVEQGLNKSWEGKIVIVTEAIDKPGTPNGWNEASDGTLLAAIKSDNDLEFSLTIPGRELSLDNEMLLASADDDYGTSYYYRGAVKNNYVQFANKCWRIVRITGDGSIKMVLYNDNSKGVSLPCSSIYFSNDASFARNPNTAYITTFNEKTNDNAYVGFMYGAAGASDYVSTHTNSNKSSVLANLEIWYNNNLSSYDSIISDVIWCNDKSTFTSLNSGTLYGTGLGYGLNETGYGSYNRLNGGNASLYATPNLICQNDNNGGKLSKFTVNDTIYGNGNLDKKIGLLTVDEVLFSGYAKGLQNSSAFLVTGPVYWWTMSPCSFEKQSARVATINGDVVTCDVVDDPIALRPAIALSSSAPVTKGDGTSENPYVVK